MRKQEKTLIIVALADFLSTVIKFFVGYSMHSMALSAEAWHSLGDFGTTLIVLMAIILDRREKYDREKEKDDTIKNEKKAIIRKSGWELRASMVIGVLLLIISFSILQKSISGVQVPIRKPIVVFFVTVVLMLISYIRFNFEKTVGEETGSPALTADAYHSRVDMYALGLILATLIGEYLGIPLDRWAALVIGFMIMGIAFNILYSSTKMLLRQSRTTEPEDRSVEDNLVIIFLGGVSQKKRTVQDYFTRKLNLDDVEYRNKLLKKLTIMIVIICAAVYSMSGFYIVKPQEQAIVEVFGKPYNLNNPAGPGLHYAPPKPIGRVLKVDVETIRRRKIGYIAGKRDIEDLILWTNVHYEREFAVLTGDNTFLDVAAHVHFKIVDPGAYLFNSAKPIDLMETVIYRSILEVMETEPFFNLLTVNRDDVERLIAESSQSILDRMDVGIKIIHIYLKDMHPPMDVAPAFEDVVSAQEDKESYIEKAIGYEKSQLPSARGEAAKRIAEAEAERSKTVMMATGKTNAFKTLEYAFQKYTYVNQIRLYLETLEAGLADTEKYILDPALTRGPIDLYFNTSKKGLMSLPEMSGGINEEQK